MLKIECSNCNEWVHLPFHADITETTCPGCSAVIPVKDVYVSAGPYIILRDVLLKHMYKYRKLLMEAEKDMEDIKRKGENVKGIDVTVNSMNVFVSHLKEMLAGCRNSLRHQVSERIDVQLSINRQTVNGKIVNISISGMCVDAGKVYSSTTLGNELEIRLGDGEHKLTSFAVIGKVVWAGKDNFMGIKFSNVDQKTQELIKDYIAPRKSA
ncbi:PilZ domain-containing protein [bacterium]|nr:MAG: PilZ domain-containing protein [bacterium]